MATLRPLGVMGLISRDQVFGKPDSTSEDDVVKLQLLDQIELRDGGEYFAIFGGSSLYSQGCIGWPSFNALADNSFRYLLPPCLVLLQSLPIGFRTRVQPSDKARRLSKILKVSSIIMIT